MSRSQVQVLRAYEELLLEINAKHNLVSQSSTGDFWRRHVLHSLTIVALRPLAAGTVVVDWGTGGGLPGLPLAIACPEAQFVLVDSIGKKARAVQLIIRRLGLTNAEAWHGRAEEWPGAAHYAVSRATAPLADLWTWTRRSLQPFDVPETAWPQGLLALKGGDLSNEIADVEAAHPGVGITTFELEPLLNDPSLAQKLLVHVTQSERLLEA